VRRDLGGFFSGLDRRFGAWRAGIAAGYTNSQADVSARASSADIDAAHLAAYAGTSLGPGISVRAPASAGTSSTPAG